MKRLLVAGLVALALAVPQNAVEAAGLCSFGFGGDPTYGCDPCSQCPCCGPCICFLGYGCNPCMLPAYAYLPPAFAYNPYATEAAEEQPKKKTEDQDNKADDKTTALPGAQTYPTQSAYQGPSYWYGY